MQETVVGAASIIKTDFNLDSHAPSVWNVLHPSKREAYRGHLKFLPLSASLSLGNSSTDSCQETTCHLVVGVFLIGLLEVIDPGSKYPRLMTEYQFL